MIDVRSLPALRVAHHTYIGDDDPSAANTQDVPDRIVPRLRSRRSAWTTAWCGWSCLPLSWNMLRIGGDDQ